MNISAALHSLLRALSMALTIVSLPVSALMCRGMSLLAVAAYEDTLGGKPLPAITTAVTLAQAQSLGLFYGSIALAVVLGALAAFLFRIPNENPWKATGQVLVTALAGSLSFGLFACTMFAGFLPFVSFVAPMR